MKQIFKKEKTVDFWNELTDEQQTEIKQAESEIQKAEIIDYDTFMANHR